MLTVAALYWSSSIATSYWAFFAFSVATDYQLIASVAAPLIEAVRTGSVRVGLG